MYRDGESHRPADFEPAAKTRQKLFSSFAKDIVVGRLIMNITGNYIISALSFSVDSYVYYINKQRKTSKQNNHFHDNDDGDDDGGGGGCGGGGIVSLMMTILVTSVLFTDITFLKSRSRSKGVLIFKVLYLHLAVHTFATNIR